MSAHTPGPWEARRIKGHPGWSGWNIRATNRNGDPTILAETRAPVQAEGSQEANARLIAAAPDLLASCEALCTAALRITSPEVHGDIVGLALVAIQKAQGKA